MNISTIYLKSGKYTYKITYKQTGGLPNHRPIKRPFVPAIRPPVHTLFDKHDNMIKEIVYPDALHNTEVKLNDPVESYIQSIMEFMPDWQKIEIQEP